MYIYTRYTWNTLYIYMYIHTHIYIAINNINNVLDAKIVLKTLLFIKNILLYLQKLRQYNKNLTKHQTKVNTAVDTN